MFDVGSGEMIVIAVVALAILGPKEMFQVLRGLGAFTRKVQTWVKQGRSLLEDENSQDLLETYIKDAQKTAAHFQPLESEFPEPPFKKTPRSSAPRSDKKTSSKMSRKSL